MRVLHAGENISMTYSVFWVIANDSVTLSMIGSRHASNTTYDYANSFITQIPALKYIFNTGFHKIYKHKE